jgi:hypothetical protein
VAFDVKMVHHGCSVYLFDRIPVKRVPDPAKEKIIYLMLAGTPVRRLSFSELSKLPADSEGHRELVITLP